MHALRRIAKPVSAVVLSGFLALTLHLPAAHAALIGTDTVLGIASGDAARAELNAALAREEVGQALVARGVNPADVQARVAALSDEEAADLAAKLDQLPAGGDALGAVVFVFLVLLVTDLLCLTNLFPFVNKSNCKR